MTSHIRALMSTPPITVSPATTLRELAAVLAEHQIAGVPVVAEAELVGIVTESDVIEKERGPDEEFSQPAGLLAHRHRRPPAASAVTVGEAMTSPPVVVEAWMSPYEAAWLMSSHDVSRLPVVDRGRLVGIVSRADLVRYFAREDREIERDIEEEVLDALGLADVSVSVQDGRAVLEGEADRETDLRCLHHAASRVLGVVAVDVHVTQRDADDVTREQAVAAGDLSQ